MTVEENDDVENQFLITETSTERENITYSSLPRSESRSKNSFAVNSIIYTIGIATVISMLCVCVSISVSSPIKDRPIEMEEEKALPTKLSNTNLLDPHQQGSDDYTADYYPYNHRFQHQNLWLDGDKGDVTPKSGYHYHIEFFGSAGYTYMDTENYLPVVKEITIGQFSGVDKETGDILLTGGTDCGDEGLREPRSGVIHVVYGESVSFKDIAENTPCKYDITVTSPDVNTNGPSASPSVVPEDSPVTEKKAQATRLIAAKKMVGIDDGKNCDEGFFVKDKWTCKKDKEDSNNSNNNNNNNNHESDEVKRASSSTKLEGIDDGDKCEKGGCFKDGEWTCQLSSCKASKKTVYISKQEAVQANNGKSTSQSKSQSKVSTSNSSSKLNGAAEKSLIGMDDGKDCEHGYFENDKWNCLDKKDEKKDQSSSSSSSSSHESESSSSQLKAANSKGKSKSSYVNHLAAHAKKMRM